MRHTVWAFALVAGLSWAGPAPIFGSAPPAAGATLASLDSQLLYQHGRVSVGDGIAEFDLGPQFRYLSPELAEKVLVEGWGNPPGGKNLGMLVPAGLSPLTDEGWGVVITFEKDGYVDDKGAETIDYDDLLKTLQKGTREENEERKKAGYPALELVGWAEAPHYDKVSHKLYWAQDLKLMEANHHSLNYNVRVLGRRGVLVLNAVSRMEQLPGIRTAMQQLLPMVEFNPGHRYADFLPGKDKVAEYGVGALILGTVAAKTGLLKVLLAGLLAAKKLVIVGFAAAAAGIKKMFGRKKDETGLPPVIG